MIKYSTGCGTKHFNSMQFEWKKLTIFRSILMSVYRQQQLKPHRPITNRANSIINNNSNTLAMRTIVGEYCHRKYRQAYTYYEKFVHLNEVRDIQEKVIEIQEQLQRKQDCRRALSQDLLVVRKELQNVHDALGRCPKSDSRYLELLQREFDLLRTEKETLDRFQMEDAAERELFTYLTAAVRSSHEKERIYENTVKYWSVMGSIIGAGLGVLATVIGYRYRHQHYQIVIDKFDIIQQRIDNVEQLVEQHNQQILQKLTEYMERLKSNEINNERKKHQQINRNANSDSWTNYFWRKTASIYRYFIPN